MPPYKTHTNVENDVYLKAWSMYIEENLKLGNHLSVFLDEREDGKFEGISFMHDSSITLFLNILFV